MAYVFPVHFNEYELFIEPNNGIVVSFRGFLFDSDGQLSDERAATTSRFCGFVTKELEDWIAQIFQQFVFENRAVNRRLPLKARIKDGCISIKWLDKWRPIHAYRPKQVPTLRIQKLVISRFLLNAGLKEENHDVVLNFVEIQ